MLAMLSCRKWEDPTLERWPIWACHMTETGVFLIVILKINTWHDNEKERRAMERKSV